MTNTTPNEFKVLRSLRTNTYGDGGESSTYARYINDSDEPSGLTGKTLAGVVGSLAKKGLVKCYGEGNEAEICLTDKGREAADKVSA